MASICIDEPRTKFLEPLLHVFVVWCTCACCEFGATAQVARQMQGARRVGSCIDSGVPVKSCRDCVTAGDNIATVTSAIRPLLIQ